MLTLGYDRTMEAARQRFLQGLPRLPLEAIAELAPEEFAVVESVESDSAPTPGGHYDEPGARPVRVEQAPLDPDTIRQQIADLWAERRRLLEADENGAYPCNLDGGPELVRKNIGQIVALQKTLEALSPLPKVH